MLIMPNKSQNWCQMRTQVLVGADYLNHRNKLNSIYTCLITLSFESLKILYNCTKNFEPFFIYFVYVGVIFLIPVCLYHTQNENF